MWRDVCEKVKVSRQSAMTTNEAEKADETAPRISMVPGEMLLLDIPTAARFLGMSRRGFWRNLSDGTIPLTVLHIGRLARIRRRELEDWLNAGAPSARRWHWRSA